MGSFIRNEYASVLGERKQEIRVKRDPAPPIVRESLLYFHLASPRKLFGEDTRRRLEMSDQNSNNWQGRVSDNYEVNELDLQQSNRLNRSEACQSGYDFRLNSPTPVDNWVEPEGQTRRGHSFRGSELREEGRVG